ncbi:MAG: DUF4407 domain-containing protein [Moorea sp. SIOASIH]|uniref:DUF4407 domain-containing protein n=1 Tax=Moorena sp. SIOASIH TaxID=2607817 RepID=UPI0013BA42DF|nr:DUF4407 domain-containing protein [Moorena sp. SIOASIH]NEO34977.1 DUF4407 domain-containing protein [Moorena sp. SIOASIH]
MAIDRVPGVYVISQDEVGIVYKKFGSPLPSNRQIALNGEMGWQVDTLGPGRHFRSRLTYKVFKQKAIQIDKDEIGLVTANDGASLPTGKMFGKVVEECDDFQDGRAFINNGGQRGRQLGILRNGIYRINTQLFSVEIRPITHINDYEIGLVEAKDGKPLPIGKTFGDAVECKNFEDAQAFINNGGYRSQQLKILTTGKYAINTELFKIKRVELIKIGVNEVGLVEARDGEPLPLGQNFGKVVECGTFQDAEAFIKNGGQQGNQLAIIPPGIHYINTELFKVHNVPVINIRSGEIGLVIAQDGAELPPGQILAKAVDCDNFQNAEAFVKNGGQQGKQRAIITEGYYRINTELFTVVTTDNAKQYGLNPEQLKVYRVESGKIGIVTTFDGKPLPGGDIAGPVIEGHNKFQEPQEFIDKGGYRGLQEEFIEEGFWSLNPWFVEVEQVPLTNIKSGTVGVLISNVGKNSQANQEQTTYGSQFNIGYKGIQNIPIEAGTHPINTRVKSIVIVPVHEITLDWRTDKNKPATNYDYNLETLKLRSKDGFILNLEVTQVINISPKNSPKMISRVGSPNANSYKQVEEQGGVLSCLSNGAVKYSSIKNLVNRVLEPMVDNYFRNSAQEYNVLDFLQQRDQIQERATEHIKSALNAYGVEAVGTFINEIGLPAELQHLIQAPTIKDNLNSLEKFLLWSAGADHDILAQKECLTERYKYTAIGTTVLLTSTTAIFSGGYAIFTVFGSVAASCVGGTFWSFIVFNLDRFLILSSKRRKSDSNSNLPFIAATSLRLLIALLLSFVVAKPLELRLFEKEINQKIKQNKNEIREEKINEPIKELEQEIKELNKEKDKYKNEWKDAENVANAEAEGTQGTGQFGKGIVYQDKRNYADEIKQKFIELDNKVKDKEEKIDKLRQERNLILQSPESNLEQLNQEQIDKESDGFLARLVALEELSKDDPNIRNINWLITALFVTIEISPILVKLLSGKGPYDYLLEQKESQENYNEYFRIKKEQRLLLSEELSKKYMKKINDFEQ